VSEQITEHVSEEDPITLLPGAPHTSGHNSGRGISWFGTGTVIVGFVIGGVAFFMTGSAPAPNWIVFWVGAAVAILGCISLMLSKTMSTDWY
jgi:hypothetical protein